MSLIHGVSVGGTKHSHKGKNLSRTHFVISRNRKGGIIH